MQQEINVPQPIEEAPLPSARPASIYSPADRVKLIEAEFLNTEEAYVKHLQSLLAVHLFASPLLSPLRGHVCLLRLVPLPPFSPALRSLLLLSLSALLSFLFYILF